MNSVVKIRKNSVHAARFRRLLITLPDRFTLAWDYVQKREWLFCLILAAATLLAYVPAWNGTPLWDDDAHLVRVSQHSFGGLEHIWLQPATTQQYHPMVDSVFWAEARLWGDTPLGYHLVNIALHIVSALLLLAILRHLEIPGAWLAAALFALHPVQVESVAWLVELKNTLSAVFFLAAVLAWFRFERVKSREAYALVMTLFVLGLMAKTIVALLPVVLLVILWWKRGKLSWKQDVRPLVPFFAIGLIAGVVTGWMEKKFSGAEGGLFELSFIGRFLVAGRAFWFYLGKLLWPGNLIFTYPRWNINPGAGWQYLFPLAVLMLFAALVHVYRRFGLRGPLAGMLIFAVLLFPLLGFFNVYYFTFSFVADHFQYLPSLGVIILASASVALGLDRLHGRPLLAARSLCVAVVLTLAILTARQSRMYADAKTAYLTTLERNPDSWMAHDNLGSILVKEGRLDEAIAHYRQALRIRPDSAKTECNLGVALLGKGNIAEAAVCFQNAITARPSYAQAYNNLGNAFSRLGRTPEAITCYQKAISLDPAYEDPHENLARVFLDTERGYEAVSQYRLALALRPGSPEIENGLGVALVKIGKVDEAIGYYQAALASRPDYAEAHNNLGIAFLRNGRVINSIEQFRKAMEIPPGHANAQNNLAWLLATWPDPAFRNGATAVDLASKLNQRAGGRNVLILTTLAAAYAETGKFEEARETAHRALLFAEDPPEPSLIRALQTQIKLYESGQPLRDPQNQAH